MKTRKEQKTNTAEIEVGATNETWLDQAIGRDRGTPRHIDTPLIGTLIGFTATGQAIVTYPDCLSERLHALSNVKLMRSDINRAVTLVFERGDASRPIILGVVQDPALEELPTVLNNEQGIILQSGDASIELSADGTVRIRGDYVESVSYGTHRIQGGSVKIN